MHAVPKESVGRGRFGALGDFAIRVPETNVVTVLAHAAMRLAAEHENLSLSPDLKKVFRKSRKANPDCIAQTVNRAITGTVGLEDLTLLALLPRRSPDRTRPQKWSNLTHIGRERKWPQIGLGSGFRAGAPERI